MDSVKIKKRVLSLFSLFAFLLGFTSVNNIIYVFVIGNTPIYLNVVVALVFDIYVIFFCKKGKMKNVFEFIPKSFNLFIIFMFLSIVPAIMFSCSYISRWINGVIAFFLFFSIIIAVSYMEGYFDALFVGLECGVIVNFLFVIFEIIQYSRGIVFRLDTVFPFAGITGANLYNRFRAIGLFKEPGHLARYLSVFIIVLFTWDFCKREKTKAYFILGIGTIMVALTRSSAAAYYLMAIIMVVILISKNNIKELIRLLLVMTLVLAFAFIALRNTSLWSSITESLIAGVGDIFTSLFSAKARTSGMKNAIKLIKDYPITGVGWNELTSHFMERGYYTEFVKGSYSAALQYFAQMGIFSLPFFYFMIKQAIKLLKSKMPVSRSVGLAMIICFLLFCTTDFTFDMAMALLFGLAIFKKGLQSDDNN